tara:strand:- start:822 stop:1469 length:648 start_codon:yes stop_codon:yes gene_type:complete
MLGDKIIIKRQHKDAARIIGKKILHSISNFQNKFIVTISGESGSGKSETATALSEFLNQNSISNVILRQDDYFVYPPKTNNFMRREDKNWRGMKEVKLDLLDAHLKAFKNGEHFIEKPVVDYGSNTSQNTNFNFFGANLIIVEGTYTSTLSNVDIGVFIDRNFHQTLEHRQNRNRDSSELDDFTKQVLQKEHSIISKHRALADIIINSDYSVEIQ